MYILNDNDLAIDGFDWDDGNQEHCTKHGLSRLEIEEFFQQDHLLIAPSPLLVQREERYLAVGRSWTGKPMVVVFTIRTFGERIRLRPISARYMHKKEAQKYEEQRSKI